MFLLNRAALAVVLVSGLSCAAHAQGGGLDQLTWLAGCWGTEGAEAGSGEFWVVADDGDLLGLSRTVRDGRTESYEFMEISRIDGRVVFTAEPSCQAETRFALLEMEDGAVTFSNPLHDFPQRITYRQVAQDRLLAHVEGLVGGAQRFVELDLRRQDCALLGARPEGATTE